MFSDFRFALRSLRRNPSFAAVAALSIALGIGANTAMFSMADAMLLRPVPVPHPSAVLNLRSQLRGHGPESMSYADYVDYRAKRAPFRADGFPAGHIRIRGRPAGAAGDEGRVAGERQLLRRARSRSATRRAFRREEDAVPGRDAVTVISHDLWQRDFGSAPISSAKRFWWMAPSSPSSGGSGKLHRHRPVFSSRLLYSADDGAAPVDQRSEPAGQPRRPELQ